MVWIRMSGGADPMDFNDKTEADRIGRRIREIRISLGLSQAELGEKVGLNADRIQKYENGARKPKPELLKEIAGALGVSTLALSDPVIANYLGVMFALFEIENTYGLEMDEINGRVALTLGKNPFDSINKDLFEWYKEKKRIEEQIQEAATEKERQTLEKEYAFWKWTYPQALVDQTSKALKKARIQNKIDQLQQELSDLDEN